jgi:hypothetical protein
MIGQSAIGTAEGLRLKRRHHEKAGGRDGRYRGSWYLTFAQKARRTPDFLLRGPSHGSATPVYDFKESRTRDDGRLLG